ncbi:MAG: hypothetical protein H6711_17825 [Myxococcales bacterium]|nr:hypothetical protein [Myxococcales bacterium]
MTIALTLGLLAVTGLLTPLPLVFRDFEPSEVMRTLTSLFTISLVLERALEVFVSTWRAPTVREHELGIQRARRRLREAGSTSEREAASEALRKLEDEAQRYRSGTHVFALQLGFTFGVAVAAVGVRALEGVLDPGALAAVSQGQSVAFRAVDVLLTGGVIAGGSEAIHKVIQLFTTFMEATTQRVKIGSAPADEPPGPRPASGEASTPS